MPETSGETLKKHKYDIDLTDLYNVAKKSFEEVKLSDAESRLLNIQVTMKSHCNAYKKDFNFISQNLYLVVDSAENDYHCFLALSLAFYDLNLIRLFLNYHKTEFKGNHYATKDEFVGLMEFIVYQIVRSVSVTDTENRLKIICDWIEEKNSNIQQEEKIGINSADGRENRIPRTPERIQNEIPDNPDPLIFKNGYAFQFFLELKESTIINPKYIVADFGFLFHKLKDHTLVAINSNVSHKMFIDFITEYFNIEILEYKLPKKFPKRKLAIFEHLHTKYQQLIINTKKDAIFEAK